MGNSRKLTEIQQHALVKTFDMSVGHAKYTLPDYQKGVIENLPFIFNESIKTPHKEIEKTFCEAYFGLAGQPSYRELKPTIFHYSTSISLEVLANVFRIKNMRVGLNTPTFDNLADILKRHINSNIIAVSENSLADPENIPWNQIDSLFITIPNNPTGFYLDETQFRNLVKKCKKENKLLAIDFCFRLTEEDYQRFDQYKILIEEQVDFITYEDTGKIWSIADLKVGFMLSSDSYYQIIKDISDDVLLNVSPFILNLLINIIRLEDPENIYINQLCNINRAYFRDNLGKLNFTVVNQNSKSTVEWVLHNRNIPATELVDKLETFGLFLSPGAQFYWNNFNEGEKYLRIALARDPNKFKQSVDELIHALSQN
ncbi:MAG TPA: aminotransferase class I/II-fold pyridoxal phosphate-dependent enzyme [Patescibacteria group bacterium]|nr:aminotransferase class I/II-fold pyridoxal phosphate-dependent enzyme [Patescibacteria group bacterium]